jgi:RNA polymerase sigma-70 factor (ECF subfamily)
VTVRTVGAAVGQHNAGCPGLPACRWRRPSAPRWPPLSPGPRQGRPGGPSSGRCTVGRGGALNDPLELNAVERAEIEAARQGDLEAFNRLVERYERLAFNVAYRTLGQRDEAVDATQEAFFSAFRAIGSFRGVSFKSWLLRIVVNCCYDQLRRRQRQPTDSLEALSERHAFDPPLPDRRPGPEAAALSQETAEAIQRALATLPDDQRMVVVLCDVQGLSYEEAADTLDLAVGTLKSRLSRARARLRVELTARGELPAASGRLTGEGQAAP